MGFAEQIADLTKSVNGLVTTVKGQFSKWDGQVKSKIDELESWKSNYEEAGLGLKKYKNKIGARTDYRKAVIPLVDLTDGMETRKTAFSYTAGRFELIRTNGCCVQSSVLIDVKAIKKYDSEEMDLFSVSLDTEHVKPCVFVMNGRKYGGLQVYFSPQSHYLLFDGLSNLDVIGYCDYIDVRGDDGDGVTNQEINDSLVILGE